MSRWWSNPGAIRIKLNLHADETTMIERRSIVRHKSYMQGRVYFNRRQSSINCIIREFTNTGARLQFPQVAALPDTFEVYIASKDEYFHARAIWNKGSDVGVAWLPEGTLSLPPGNNWSADHIGDRLAKLEHEVAVLHKRLDTLQGKTREAWLP
jgi:hypothetical protein